MCPLTFLLILIDLPLCILMFIQNQSNISEDTQTINKLNSLFAPKDSHTVVKLWTGWRNRGRTVRQLNLATSGSVLSVSDNLRVIKVARLSVHVDTTHLHHHLYFTIPKHNDTCGGGRHTGVTSTGILRFLTR